MQKKTMGKKTCPNHQICLVNIEKPAHMGMIHLRYWDACHGQCWFQGGRATSCFERSWNRRFFGGQAQQILKKISGERWEIHGEKKTGPAKNPSEVKQRILGGGGLNHFEPPSWKICASQIGIISPSSSCHQLVIPWSFSPSQMERIVWTNRQTT